MRVEDIEAAIDQLSPEDYRRLSTWFRERESSQWDAQIDQDSAMGRLDFLFEEAEQEAAAGKLREWPPAK